ncbi:MAG: hypothetical protein ACJAS1_004125 [Oleiphilaceae bacterium]|jgi:hypothetical protein
MKILLKRSLLATAISLGVAACGSSSSSSSDPVAAPVPAASTTFTVAVDAPESLERVAALGWDQKISRFFFPTAMAADGNDLSSENFKVVLVDAEGNVVEEVTIAAENISKNSDGTWEISVPGDPRLDCLIVVDINKPVEITVGSGVPSDVLYAPTTAVEIDVDVASTAAYQNFIEELAATPGQTFDDLGLDVDNPEDVAAVEAVVERVQQVFEELVSEGSLDLTVGSLEQMLAAADAKVEEIIEQEISNVVNAATGTAAELINGGGLFWYDGEFDQAGGTTDLEVDEIERGYIGATGLETFTEYDFNDENRGWSESEIFDPSTDAAEDDRILTGDGWANSADAYRVVSINDDGTVTIQDATLSLVQEKITAVQVTSLEGRNIEDFMEVSSGDFSLIIESDKVFEAGAKAYRLGFTSVNDIYNLWFDLDTLSNGNCEYRENTPEGLGGNCETAGRIVAGQYLESTDALSDLISDAAVEDPSTDDTSFVSVDISRGDDDNAIVAELVAAEVEGNDNTANFYAYNWNGGYELLASSSWTYQTPAGLGEGEKIVVLPIPDEVFAAGEFDSDEHTFIFAEDQGYVRKGNFVAAGEVSEEVDDWVFNSTANGNILAAVDFDFLDTLTVSASSESVWDDAEDELYDGIGGPQTGTEFTYKAFERSVLLARSSAEGVDHDITADDIAGKTFYENIDESITFNEDGTGVSDDEGETYDFTWSINGEGYIINDFGDTEKGGYTFAAQDTIAAISDPTSEEGIELKILFQNSLWQQIGPDGESDTLVISANQGEVWSSTWSTVEPSSAQF